MAVVAEWKNDRFSVGLCSIPFHPTKRTNLNFDPWCFCLSEAVYFPTSCSCWIPAPTLITVSGMDAYASPEGINPMPYQGCPANNTPGCSDDCPPDFPPGCDDDCEGTHPENDYFPWNNLPPSVTLGRSDCSWTKYFPGPGGTGGGGHEYCGWGITVDLAELSMFGLGTPGTYGWYIQIEIDTETHEYLLEVPCEDDIFQPVSVPRLSPSSVPSGLSIPIALSLTPYP